MEQPQNNVMNGEMKGDTRVRGPEGNPPLSERLLRNRLGIILAITLTAAALAVFLRPID